MDSHENRQLAYSVTDAARAIGVGRTRLYQEVSTGRLKSIRVGTRRLVTAEALREFLDLLAVEADS